MSRALFLSTLQALKNVKENLYVQYIGINLANISKLPPGYTKVREKKSRLEMLQITAAVCGIELCYAAETAFVSPVLLKLGVPVTYMTWVWCLSPLLGFFLVPIFGSMSDRCKLRLGRRRPFILMMSAGIIVGLVLIPNGEYFGILAGDQPPISDYRDNINGTLLYTNYASNSTVVSIASFPRQHIAYRGIILTIVGVILLDFNCDACQSPSRSYLLDVTLPEEHNTGITTFTIMAGLGGSVGYIMGGIDWNTQALGSAFEGHVRTVFMVVLGIFIPCVLLTVTSSKEIPLEELDINVEKYQKKKKKVGKSKYEKFDNESDTSDEKESDHIPSYDSLGSSETEKNPAQNNEQRHDSNERTETEKREDKEMTYEQIKQPVDAKMDIKQNEAIQISTDVTLKTYLRSIIHMPKSLSVLCLTNLFCWMSLVCYSLYFTDFVGQAVYQGDPSAPRGSIKHERYDKGVRLGSFAMSLYSLSCAIYSYVFERLVKKFKARTVYVCGQLAYSVGMVVIALSRHPITVILMSPSAGIMYSTLFTMPYLLVAHYHTTGQFTEPDQKILTENSKQVRGLGTDVALISSMVFVAQFLLSSCMGSIIHVSGTTAAVIVAAAVLSLCGALTATQVLYLDL
ncbi:solute carrier family 45 member 4 [Octopus bimaculoides]|uniref:Major facilitator superfamily (MFS) profile domain-containing protein n=1 Tax=Octopus bimaculoides TaxID=37653 RepID=A0A0L8HY01_OCTBM|nr:solute carrier family 45 member 4 [Octopus bimaculoides]XP_052823364.1 solute carrier family 45 member 4 [Octopus bimaculoides]|eukprot:XP_014768744.1 PREDICTED: solute carrier family 45 member 4-like [Octopus bimaculoides]